MAETRKLSGRLHSAAVRLHLLLRTSGHSPPRNLEQIAYTRDFKAIVRYRETDGKREYRGWAEPPGTNIRARLADSSRGRISRDTHFSEPPNLRTIDELTAARLTLQDRSRLSPLNAIITASRCPRAVLVLVHSGSMVGGFVSANFTRYHAGQVHDQLGRAGIARKCKSRVTRVCIKPNDKSHDKYDDEGRRHRGFLSRHPRFAPESENGGRCWNEMEILACGTCPCL